MGKNQQMIKLFVVLLFSTAFIFSFSHYGAKAFEKITNADGKFSDGTTIGALNISGKTEDEAKSLLELESKQEDLLELSPIIVEDKLPAQLDEEKEPLDDSLFDFLLAQKEVTADRDEILDEIETKEKVSLQK